MSRTVAPKSRAIYARFLALYVMNPSSSMTTAFALTWITTSHLCRCSTKDGMLLSVTQPQAPLVGTYLTPVAELSMC
jgi:hypothetical protein